MEKLGQEKKSFSFIKYLINIPFSFIKYLINIPFLFIEFLRNVNWAYRWQKIKDNKYYIIGFLLLISIPWLPDWPLIGPIYRDVQTIGIIKNDPSVARLLTECIIIAIFVVSWDLLSGYSGQISFGHAIFFGMGAYITILTKVGISFTVGLINVDHPGIDNNIVEIGGVPVNFGMLQATVIGAFIVAIFGLFVGLLTLRSKGPYFALITLVIPLIAGQLVLNDELVEYTGGEGGKILQPSQWVVPKAENQEFTEILELQFRVILVVGLICIAIMYMIAKSRIGIVLQAIREDELAASSSGVNVNFYKVLVIGISAFFAAFAGGLSPHIFNSATPGLFEADKSFQVIIFGIVGGLASITGAVIASFFFIPLLQWYVSDAFIDTPTIEVLILALILMFALRFQPLGLIRASNEFKNAIKIAVVWTLSLAFYDATDDDLVYGQTTTGLKVEQTNLKSVIGEFFKKLHPSWSTAPEQFLIDTIGEDGLFGINVATLQGRLILYFLIGMVIGYWGPELFRKLRLKLWGVWPSLGKYEPPN